MGMRDPHMFLDVIEREFGPAAARDYLDSEIARLEARQWAIAERLDHLVSDYPSLKSRIAGVYPDAPRPL